MNSPTISSLGTPIHAVVHLGAGRCRELEEYQRLDPAELLLVEADPQIADLLTGRFARLPQARVLNAAVAAVSGPANFYRHNVRDTSSLHQPSGLYRLFPGLRVTETLPVQTRAVAEVLEQLHLDERRNNLLVVDLPGEELSILQATHDAGLLHRFSHVQLHCGLDELYVGAPAAKAVIDWLEEAGFDVLEQLDSGDPERPTWLLKRNALFLRHRDLAREFELLRVERDQHMARAVEVSLELEKQAGDLRDAAHRIADLEGQLAALNEAHAGQVTGIKALQTELAQRITERDDQAKALEGATGQLEDAGRRIADLEGRLATLNEAQAGQITRTKALEAEVAQRTAERDEQARLRQEGARLIDDLRTEKLTVEKQRDESIRERDALAAQAAEREGTLAKQSKDLAEASRLSDELKAQLATTQKARDEQARLAAERQAQLTQATKTAEEQAQLARGRQEEINKLSAALKEAQGQLARQQEEFAQTEQRQQLMNEELARAEGQIHFIRDVLFREPGL